MSMGIYLATVGGVAISGYCPPGGGGGASTAGQPIGLLLILTKAS